VPGASPADVRQAAAAKAAVLRPDAVSGSPTKVIAAADKAWAAVEAARQCLTDPAARRQYDQQTGISGTGSGLERPAPVPSEPGPDLLAATRGGLDIWDAAAVTLEMLADALAPRPAPPRHVRVPEVRGLFIGPCRHLLARLGLRIDVVALTADPEPAEGLVVDQAPPPGAAVARSAAVTVQVWHPPRHRSA
jgi:hypothetical protein